MKRLLLIAHVFPPEPSPGALRPGYLAHYLPEFGWDVTVVTNSTGVPPFACDVATTGRAGISLQDRVRQSLDTAGHQSNSALRALVRATKGALLFPDEIVPWVGPALTKASSVLREKRYDALLSTALPASVHIVGSLLAGKSGLPWVADYRDPWFGNRYVHRGPVRRRLEGLFERGLLRKATAVTTISEAIARQIGSFLHRADIAVIPNAYDPQEWSAFEEIEPAGFDLTYTGSMYDGKRSPDLLFAALSEMTAQREPAAEEAAVHFYGPNSETVAANAAAYGLGERVKIHGKVARSEAMKAQRAAAAVLIFLNMDPETAHEMGSKFLEYVGARRPIIAFGPTNSALRDFIERHHLGWFASSVEEAKIALRSAYRTFQNGFAEVEIDTEAVLTARELAKTFAKVLNGAVERRASVK